MSFDDELPAPRKESEVSLLSNQLKELEDKTQEILYLQQELNELNASLKEEKWYSAALKEEVDKITKEKVELEEKNSLLEKVCDQYQISPHNTNTSSREKVMRINELITKGKLL